MNKSIIALTLLLASTQLSAQTLYSKAFGNPTDNPLIYLHGGPGFNSAGFEITSAQALADQGFYLIVYDRRGEGRSEDVNAAFTFDQTFEDITTLYATYHIDKAGLIGHSFGGIIATLFAEKHPERVSSIILVGAPVSLQETFVTIIETSEKIYETKKDSANLKYVKMLKTMDTSSMAYSSYSFMHAMQNGFYFPKNPSEHAKTIYGQFRTNPVLITYASKMTYEAPQAFWKNEHYTTIDLTATLKRLKQQEMPIFGLYGKEDGLYSEMQIMNLKHLIGEKQLLYLDNCSHNVFIDRQAEFNKTLKNWLK